MPPALITRTVAGGTGVMGTLLPSPIGIGFANAAVAAAEASSRPVVTAARTVATRQAGARLGRVAIQWRDRW
jgi:hypothetical protein